MKTLLAFLVCYAVAPALAQRAPLSPGPGEDAVEASCSICHSLSYIPMNSPFMAPEIWKAEVTKMRTAFGAPIDDDAANAIIDYLTSHYGAPAK
jgi:cytochrome c5